CLRRKRFSAASARREWTARMARRIRSITTGTIVRKQCATVRKSDEPDINSQHGTLQNVTGPTTAAWQEFLRTTGPCGAARVRERCWEAWEFLMFFSDVLQSLGRLAESNFVSSRIQPYSILLLFCLLLPAVADENPSHAVVPLMTSGIEDHVALIVRLPHLDD